MLLIFGFAGVRMLDSNGATTAKCKGEIRRFALTKACRKRSSVSSLQSLREGYNAKALSMGGSSIIIAARDLVDKAVKQSATLSTGGDGDAFTIQEQR